MAGPTDILTEDVKDLRDAIRPLAVEIKGVFERHSAGLRDSNQRRARLTHHGWMVYLRLLQAVSPPGRVRRIVCGRPNE